MDSSNSPTFRLLDLPTEIREIVFEHAYAGTSIFCYHSQTRTLQQQQQSMPPVSNYRLLPLPSRNDHFALASTNRRIRRKAFPIYLRTTILAYGLARPRLRLQGGVTDTIKSTYLKGLHHLSFPQLDYCFEVANCFCNLKCLEIGEAGLQPNARRSNVVHVEEYREQGWQITDLIAEAKADIFMRESFAEGWSAGEDLTKPRSFKIRAFVVLSVPTEPGRAGFADIHMVFDWTSGRLVRPLKVVPAGAREKLRWKGSVDSK